ncbi:hypothetical protein NONI108955_20680 [Nocardia ninae]|uniref:Uncharacterized protein n=1 Tax=Nocardia ninae NBRC 108245 TaxID=1210091 RepID=A0A511MA40_9NOCA|nr:hypothetical protein [Nocardia ninae]GEM37371.1 hypothetical protein NN4_18900 [Nocardia ninae NBRC 108245]
MTPGDSNPQSADGLPMLVGAAADIDVARQIRANKLALLDMVADRIAKADASGGPSSPSAAQLVPWFRRVFLDQKDPREWIAVGELPPNAIFHRWITATEIDDLIAEYGVYSIPYWFER